MTTDPADPITLVFLGHTATALADRAAYDAYLADGRRVERLRRFGDVFTSTRVVEMEPIPAGPLPR